MPLRVRFSETDAMGVANNAAYLAWFEVGRVEYLREIGHSYADVHSGGMDMVVVEAHVSYLRPSARAHRCGERRSPSATSCATSAACAHAARPVTPASTGR